MLNEWLTILVSCTISGLIFICLLVHICGIDNANKADEQKSREIFDLYLRNLQREKNEEV